MRVSFENSLSAVAFCALIGALPVQGQEAAPASEPVISSTLSLTAEAPLSFGHISPAFGAGALVSGSPFATQSVSTLSGATLSETDISGSYMASLRRASVGLFGDVADRPTPLSIAPSTAWNLGASVGYAGFYVRGGITDVTPTGPFQGLQGWQAGLGYGTGNLDVRVTFAAAQAEGLHALNENIDRQQWMIGGMYQLSDWLRLNADAFYGTRPAFAAAPAAAVAAPQGTGARVGVKLQF